MELMCYFADDDGTLPEIELHFARPEDTTQAFALLFEFGAKDATADGARVWQKHAEVVRAFAGPNDANLVVSGEIDPFHLVLAGIRMKEAVLPELGVFVSLDSLTLDYRMGNEWGDAEVQGLVVLLRALRDAGASIRVPWWGEQGEARFLAALSPA